MRYYRGVGIKRRFLGIDLASAETEPSACLGLDGELKLIYYGFPNSNCDILEIINRYRFKLIAVDAPLSLPKGLCRLEESCSCQEEARAKGRECERELAKLGIPCYFTTKKSIIKIMVYRGIRLRAELKARGYEVIEVYPHASKTRIWGESIPRKTTSAGLGFLKRHTSRLIPSLAPYVAGFNHDLCDAAIAAYTAFLYSQGKTEPTGEPDEGVIYLPFLDRLACDH